MHREAGLPVVRRTHTMGVTSEYGVAEHDNDGRRLHDHDDDDRATPLRRWRLARHQERCEGGKGDGARAGHGCRSPHGGK